MGVPLSPQNRIYKARQQPDLVPSSSLTPLLECSVWKGASMDLEIHPSPPAFDISSSSSWWRNLITVLHVQWAPFTGSLWLCLGTPGGSDLKSLPAVRETWVRSLGGEDPLEKGTATHSGILAWRIPWTESPAGYSPWGRKEQDATEWLHFHFPFFTAMHLHLERVEGAAPHPPQTLALRELKVRKALLFNGCLVQLQKTLWTVARQAPLSTGLARQ